MLSNKKVIGRQMEINGSVLSSQLTTDYFQDIELAIQKVETEKANRDHAISSLNDEIAQQDEVINKLNKEKKHINESQAKSSEDLQSAEDKVGHLTSVKNKLESTLDDIESSVDKEKRSRGNLEKERRKLEGELKLAQALDRIANSKSAARCATVCHVGRQTWPH